MSYPRRIRPRLTHQWGNLRRNDSYNPRQTLRLIVTHSIKATHATRRGLPVKTEGAKGHPSHGFSIAEAQ